MCAIWKPWRASSAMASSRTARTDGFFLADDSNDAFAQHTGAQRFDDADLERWVELLERRQGLLRDRGGEYVFLVAPESHSVYRRSFRRERRMRRNGPCTN
jgi:hypothetical protein